LVVVSIQILNIYELVVCVVARALFIEVFVEETIDIY